MIFNSLVFVAFFVAAYAAYFFVSSDRRTRLWILTLANLVFYGTWSWKFVPILLGTGVLDFYIARAIFRCEERKQRAIGRRYLAVSIVLNVGVLAIFKYTNFALGAAGDISRLFGGGFVPPILHIVVPLGISFYTFQSMSYTIDVYLDSFKPKNDLIEFLASLTFFPHLLAGPIVRSSFLLPQFRELSPPDMAMVRRGCLLIALGAMKKTVADLMGPIAGEAFHQVHVGQVDALSAWGSLIAFMGQLYGDFSGYTDMATGMAALFGFVLPPNFNLPYLSTSPGMFWSRWHISLSTWFRDYLYYPLAMGWLKAKPYRNTMVVMLVAGIWHGAGWNYVALGLYYGVGIATVQFVGRRWPRTASMESPLRRLVAWAATMYFITTAQIFFRAQSLGDALRYFRGAHVPAVSCANVGAGWRVLIVVAFGTVACHVVDYFCIFRDGGLKRGVVLWPVAVMALTIAIVFASNQATFIYFQF